MDYIDEYKLRLNGKVSREIDGLRQKGMNDFIRYQKRSPNGVTFEYNGANHLGVLLSATSVQDEKKFYCYLLTSLETNLPNGAIALIGEKRWLVLHKDEHEYNCYYKYKVILLDYKLQYIDKNGQLAEFWAYVVTSSVREVKDLFKLASGLIFDLPTSRIQAVCAAQPNLPKDARFLIQDQAWEVAPIDKVSIEGVWYITLSQTQTDPAYDASIADELNPIKNSDNNTIIVGPHRIRITETIELSINFVGPYSIELSNNLLTYRYENNKLILQAGNQLGTCIVTLKSNDTIISEKPITIVNIWSK